MKQVSNIIDSQKTGRPRTYDREKALDAAMLTFWKHGYETTSMSVLSHKMNMNAPSIYSAFGDKKALFLLTLDRYVGSLEEIKKFIDESPKAYDAVEKMLILSAERFTAKDTPPGCMLASAVATGSAGSADVQAEATSIRRKIGGFLKTRIALDIKNKILSENTSADGLAAFTIATIQGMAVLARDGASRKKLFLIIGLALGSWDRIK